MTMLQMHDRFSPELIRGWDELAERTDANPFLRAGWFLAWWRAFGKGRLEVLTVHRHARMVGVVAMTRHRGGLVSASNWHSPMFGFLAEDVTTAGMLGSAVLRRAGHAATVRFLDEGDHLTEPALARAAAGRVRRLVLERSPYIDTEGDWESYENGLETRRRRELRRRWRRLKELGQVTFEVDRGERDLDQLFNEGLGVEGSGWKDQRGTAIQAQPETRQFYREVAGWAADRGWLVLAFLRLDGRPLAFDYCLEHDGVHYLLKTGYDPRFRHLAPGMLLRHEMIRRAHTGSVSMYDFLGDDNPWKLDWTNRFHQRSELRVYPRSALGSASWCAERYGRSLAGRVRRAVPGWRQT
jgi:CelD/BcsL family acetyltransferase involved in cellulose biosynthesis